MQADVEFIILDLMRRLGMHDAVTVPKHVKVVIDLVGGNPRLLEHALACMSGKPNRRVAGVFP